MKLFTITLTLLLASSFAFSLSEPEVERRVEGALNAWKSESWRTMYSYLAPEDKQYQSFEEFASERKKLAGARTLEDYKVKSIKPSGQGTYLVQLELVMRENYNARKEFSVEDKIVPYPAEWKIVEHEGRPYITFR